MRKPLGLIDAGIPALFAWSIRRFLPPARWYRGTFQLSRLLAPWLRFYHRSAWNSPLLQAVFINRILALLTRSGQPFPVPWEACGLDLVRASLGQPGGLVLCSAHLPLVKVACRALLDSGLPVAGAVTDNPSVTDSLAVWGLTARMPALPVNPQVLLRARSLLQAGKAVLLLADRRPGQDFSPNIFRLAERLNSKVLLFSVDLAPGGRILVRFFEPVEAAVEGRIRELREEVDRIRLRQPLSAEPLREK